MRRKGGILGAIRCSDRPYAAVVQDVKADDLRRPSRRDHAIPDRSRFARPNRLMEFVNATRAPCQLQLQFTAARRR